MQRISEGLRYNTATATAIGEWWNGLSRNDFGFCEESLYRTPKGNYFLSGEGGARSRWSRRVENGSCGGSGISPLSKNEAFDWAQTHLRLDEVEKEFAEMIADA